MPENDIKLTDSFTGVMTRCLLSTTASVLLYIYVEQTPLMWIILIILSVVALYNWIRLLRRETILQISNEGMKYGGKMMRWDTIVDFKTVTHHDSETGDDNTTLILKLSTSYLSVNIDISRLNTDEKQIREWIKTYTTQPVDRGHRTT